MMGTDTQARLFDDPAKDLAFRYSGACRVWGEAKRRTGTTGLFIFLSVLSVPLLPLMILLAEGKHAALDFRIWMLTLGACALTCLWWATQRRRERRLEQRVRDLEHAIDTADFDIVSVGGEERTSLAFEALLRKRVE